MSKIVIDYDIRAEQAKREVLDFTWTITRSMEGVEKESEQAGKAVEDVGKKAEKTKVKTQRSTDSIGQGFRGAGEAISGATAALDLMGVKGNSAIGTIGGALASLASGAGPMALAIGGVTALVTWMTTLGDEADETRDKVSGIRDEILKLDETIRELAREKLSVELGIDPSEAGFRQRLSLSGERIREAQRALVAAESNLATIPVRRAEILRVTPQSATGLLAERLGPLDIESQRDRTSIERLRSEIEEELRVSSRINLILRERESLESDRVDAERRRTLVTPYTYDGARDPRLNLGDVNATRPDFTGSAPGVGGMAGFDFARIAYEQQFAAKEYDRALREADKQRISDMALERERVESSRLRIQASGERAAAIQATADAQARAYASSLSSVLADAALTGEFDQFAINLANVTTSALMDALASGVVQGLGVEKFASGLFGMLTGALTGGVGGGAGGAAAVPADDYLFNRGGLFDAVGSGPGKAGGDTVMFVMAPDQQMADSIVSKASANGMRAAVGRSAGRGIVAGTIPSRRR